MFHRKYTFVYSLQNHSFTFVQLVQNSNLFIVLLYAFYPFCTPDFVLLSKVLQKIEKEPVPAAMKNPKTLENPHFLCKIEKTA